MNMEEEIRKSVPYKSIKNKKKQDYDNSSDENDLDMGFPIQENVYTYNVLKDQQAINKIRLGLEGSKKINCQIYHDLTIFEELQIILHFASHQNDSFMKKIKQISDEFQREESFLRNYIKDMSYFQRFTKQNFGILIKSLTKNQNFTLISRIKWRKIQCSTSSRNQFDQDQQQQQYILEIEPNIKKEEINEQSNTTTERSINSEKIYLEGGKQFQQRENNAKNVRQENKVSSQPITLKPIQKNNINTYFDSDSYDNDDRQNDQEQNQINHKQQTNSQQNKLIRQISNESQDARIKGQKNFKSKLLQLNQQKYIEESQMESDDQDSEESNEKYEDEAKQNNSTKKRNSLNALLAETIEFNDDEYEDIEEVDMYTSQENKFFPNHFMYHSQMNSNMMVFNGVLNVPLFYKTLRNIHRNQKLSVKEFLFNKK